MTALAAASPRLQVTYGSFALDETNGIILCSEYDSEDTGVHGSFYVEFRCRLTSPTGVVDTDDAAFATLIRAVETSLRIPRQRLLVTVGTNAASAYVVRNWAFAAVVGGNYATSQTAILIEPELKLIEENCRDYRYGLRVRCQFPGNVPGNTSRRESMRLLGSTLRERRTCSITATWTSDASADAFARYTASGDAFFNAALPANFTDQHGTTGTWVLADSNPTTNDENSIVTVTRVYWEVFAGRRDSTPLTITTIDKRRVCTVTGTWVATGGNTALQNYTDNGGAFFDSVLPSVVASGEWVLVDEEPGYNDANQILTVTRTYQEVVSGLREYSSRVTTNAAGLKTLVVEGAYYSTASATARANYNTNVGALVSGLLSTESITRYESHSIPKVTGSDQNGRRYFFTHTYNEIAYAQGSTADDTNVTFESLQVEVLVPFDAQSKSGTFDPSRLKTVLAQFTATIDYPTSSDPVALWESGLRAHVVGAVTSKLGGYVSTAEVVEERVGAGLHANVLIGTLRLIVTGGGNVLSYQVVQKITQVPGREFVGRGDGTAFSYFPYRDLPEKLLFRRAVVEFMVGSEVDAFPDTTVSGFGLVETDMTAQDSIEAQNAEGDLELNSWFIDRRASDPYSVTTVPTTRGEGGTFETVVVEQVENWRYVVALEGSDPP